MTPPTPPPNPTPIPPSAPRHLVATPESPNVNDSALVAAMDDGLISLQQRLDAIGRSNESASHAALSQVPAFANAVEARRLHLLLVKMAVLSALLIALGLAAYLLWRSGGRSNRGPATDFGERSAAAREDQTSAKLDLPGWPRLATLNELNRDAAAESLRLVVLRPQVEIDRVDSPLSIRDWEEAGSATER